MRKIMGFGLLLVLCLAYGCGATLERANKGAETAGESTGKALRIPISAGEGAAEGIKGEDGPNPYKR